MISSVNAADHNITKNDNLGQKIINSSNGDTINLKEGIYTNNVTNITINKNLTIKGENAKNTILDAEKLGKVFTINGRDNTIKLINIKFINGKNNDGGAILVNQGNLILINCTFNNNSADSWGGAIFMWQGNLIMTNTNFNDNSANYGGAVHTYSGVNKVIIDNCKFTNNIGQRDGGALYNNHANITINNSKFINNQAQGNGGGAIHNNGGNNFNITNSDFINNTSKGSYGGGAIMNSHSNALGLPNGDNFTVVNCTFKNNKVNPLAIYNIGGAITNWYGHNFTIINSIFINNTAETAGSAIYNEGHDFSIINSTFYNNKNSSVIYILGNNTKVQGCDIFNNAEGILIINSNNTIVNYNRIFNNTNNTGYDLYNFNSKTNANYNWWGSNEPLVNGITLGNYFIMNVKNITSLNSNGSVTFNYTFKLNTGENADHKLLPYFITNVYTNITIGSVYAFDARYDRTFDVILNTSEEVLYTFTTDNEVQSLAGKITIPPGPKPPTPPKPPSPIPDNKDNNKTSKNTTANAIMKPTGMSINLILLVLLSSLGLLIRKKY
nr:hypothetical protein [Methanobrevibacter arboriphilus]